MITPAVTVEICVDSFALAKAAAAGGADRIELCGSLLGGGITPSAGLAAAVRNAINLPIAMLVRPRTGPFTATDDEYEVMHRKILYARDLGINIAVLGLLQHDGRVDIERTRRLVELAHPMEVTFHRAFDAAPNLQQALEDVIQTGATRILTSGGCDSAAQGAAIVGALQPASQNRISLMLCGGMRPEIAAACIAESRVQQIHAALRYAVPSHDEPATPSELSLFTEAVRLLKQSAT